MKAGSVFFIVKVLQLNFLELEMKHKKLYFGSDLCDLAPAYRLPAKGMAGKSAHMVVTFSAENHSLKYEI